MILSLVDQCGVLKPGVTVGFAPSGSSGKVFSIETYKNVEQATPGDNVGMNIKNIPKDKPICGGDVMYVVDDPNNGDTGEVSEFKATVMVQEHPKLYASDEKKSRSGFSLAFMS